MVTTVHSASTKRTSHVADASEPPNRRNDAAPCGRVLRGVGRVVDLGRAGRARASRSLYPLLWMVFSSFKDNQRGLRQPVGAARRAALAATSPRPATPASSATSPTA